jgi:hypothetical protein
MGRKEDRNRAFDLSNRPGRAPRRDLIGALNLPLVLVECRRDYLTRSGH